MIEIFFSRNNDFIKKKAVHQNSQSFIDQIKTTPPKIDILSLVTSLEALLVYEPHIYYTSNEKCKKNLRMLRLLNNAKVFGTRTNSLALQIVELSWSHTYIQTHTDMRVQFFWLYRVQKPLKREKSHSLLRRNFLYY